MSRAKNNISTTMTNAFMGPLLVFTLPTIVGEPDDSLSACVEDRVSSIRLRRPQSPRKGHQAGADQALDGGR